MIGVTPCERCGNVEFNWDRGWFISDREWREIVPRRWRDKTLCPWCFVELAGKKNIRYKVVYADDVAVGVKRINPDGIRPEFIPSAKAKCIRKLKEGILPERIILRSYDRVVEISFHPASGVTFTRVDTIDWKGELHHFSSTWDSITRRRIKEIIEQVQMFDKVECKFPEERHWLFRDLPTKKKRELPLRATLEPYIEARRVRELTEFTKEEVEEKPPQGEKVEGEVIKRRGNWILTRENLEWRRYKKPKYFYRVYYMEEGRWVLSMQDYSYKRCLDHFEYQSKQEEGKALYAPQVIEEEARRKETLKELYKLYKAGMREGTLMYTPYVAVAKSLEEGKIIIDRRNRRIIGFLRYGIGKREPVCRLLQIYVVPEYRRMGIASKLLMEFERICKANRMVKARLKTAVANVVAQRFYERHGYVATERLEKKVPEIVYEKVFFPTAPLR